MCESPPADGNSQNPRSGEPTRLRQAALRLAAELDGAGFHVPAAHVSMAADGIVGSAAAGHGEDMRTDVKTEFELDEHGRVWMIWEGDCHIIGRRGAVCAEMRRFLAQGLDAI